MAGPVCQIIGQFCLRLPLVSRLPSAGRWETRPRRSSRAHWRRETGVDFLWETETKAGDLSYERAHGAPTLLPIDRGRALYSSKSRPAVHPEYRCTRMMRGTASNSPVLTAAFQSAEMLSQPRGTSPRRQAGCTKMLTQGRRTRSIARLRRPRSEWRAAS